jgi:hypothetical protein
MPAPLVEYNDQGLQVQGEAEPNVALAGRYIGGILPSYVVLADNLQDVTELLVGNMGLRVPPLEDHD